MASDKAMPSTASVMTFPNAPGLRPTASEAFMPTSPTPIAEPRPAKPTWMLPVNSPNIGVTIMFIFIDVFVVAQRLPRLNTVEPLKIFSSMLCYGRVLLFVSANQRSKNGGQQHKYKCLDQPDQHFQKIKRDWQKRAENRFCPGGMLNRVGDCFEQISSGKDIAVKSKAQGNRPESDREHFEKADGEEYDNHQIFDEAGIVAFRTKDMQSETPNAVGTKRPKQPEHHKNCSHGESHVQIGIALAQ